jgi:hypothetical protein
MLVGKGTLNAGAPSSFTTTKERDATALRAVRCASDT